MILTQMINFVNSILRLMDLPKHVINLNIEYRIQPLCSPFKIHRRTFKQMQIGVNQTQQVNAAAARSVHQSSKHSQIYTDNPFHVYSRLVQHC